MGLRGPPKQPTELKLIKGTMQGRMPVSPHPPLEQSDGLLPPEWLDDYARQVWAETVPPLEAIGVLSSVDVYPLAAYCDAVSTWRAAVKAIDEDGQTITITDDFGKVTGIKAHPSTNIRNRALQEVLRFAGQFGLTPSARVGLSISAGHATGPHQKTTHPEMVNKAEAASKLFK